MLDAYKRKVIILEKRVSQLENMLSEKELEKNKNVINPESVAKITELQSLMNDLQFELFTLKIDNTNLEGDAKREKQTSDVFRLHYNNLIGRDK